MTYRDAVGATDPEGNIAMRKSAGKERTPDPVRTYDTMASLTLATPRISARPPGFHPAPRRAEPQPTAVLELSVIN
jgi:hypothetical protein